MAETALTKKRSGKQWTREVASRVLAACKESGLSMREFAKREGLHARRLYWWTKQLALRDAGRNPEGASAPVAKTPTTRFVPAVVKETLTTSAGVLRKGFTTLEIEDLAAVSPAWLAAVMLELERDPCS